MRNTKNIKMNAIENNNENLAIQGTTTAVMSSYFYDAYFSMLPWFMAAVPLILIDLKLGRAKARAKGEEVTFGKSLKMTIDKSFSYICWIMLSTTLSMAFELDCLKYIIMAAIYGLEVLSALRSWYIAKGIHVDEAEMLRLLFKAIWNKVCGIEEEFEGVFKNGDIGKDDSRKD